MVPWAQIAKPVSIHFAFNCFKTVLGAGFVGYGVALALLPPPSSDDKNDDNEKEELADPKLEFTKRCVISATAIGFGLFLSLPSLISQTMWESMIPGITITDLAYDLGTENLMGKLPKWNLQNPKLSTLAEGAKEKLAETLGRENKESTSSGD